MGVAVGGAGGVGRREGGTGMTKCLRRLTGNHPSKDVGKRGLHRPSSVPGVKTSQTQHTPHHSIPRHLTITLILTQTQTLTFHTQPCSISHSPLQAVRHFEVYHGSYALEIDASGHPKLCIFSWALLGLWSHAAHVGGCEAVCVYMRARLATSELSKPKDAQAIFSLSAACSAPHLPFILSAPSFEPALHLL